MFRSIYLRRRAVPAAFFCAAAFFLAVNHAAAAAAAGIWLEPVADRAASAPAAQIGPRRAMGAIVWSHGRSLNSEDSTAPTPDYVLAFAQAGWDVFRLNRLRASDTLPASGHALAKVSEMLKAEGYRRVVLAGQSFGGFISLIAADESDAPDAVIATAPAAFGTARDNPEGWGLNATRLYDLLGEVRRARVALFFFQDDEFDPGGRAQASQEILTERRLPYLLVNKPASFATHWAATRRAFTHRFARCLEEFAEDDRAAGRLSCSDSGDDTAAPTVSLSAIAPASPGSPSAGSSAPRPPAGRAAAAPPG